MTSLYERKGGLSWLKKHIHRAPLIFSLDLSGHGISSPSQCQEIISAAQTRTSIHELDLSDNPITDAGIRAICMILARDTSIRILRLSRVNIGYVGYRWICSLIRKNDKIHTLHVGSAGVGVGPDPLQSCRLMSEFHNALASNYALRKFSLPRLGAWAVPFSWILTENKSSKWHLVRLLFLAREKPSTQENEGFSRLPMELFVNIVRLCTIPLHRRVPAGLILFPRPVLPAERRRATQDPDCVEIQKRRLG